MSNEKDWADKWEENTTDPTFVSFKDHADLEAIIAAALRAENIEAYNIGYADAEKDYAEIEK